jgi:hypothetical protein
MSPNPHHRTINVNELAEELHITVRPIPPGKFAAAYLGAKGCVALKFIFLLVVGLRQVRVNLWKR